MGDIIYENDKPFEKVFMYKGKPIRVIITLHNFDKEKHQRLYAQTLISALKEHQPDLYAKLLNSHTKEDE